tara:strand:+ start:554 stop:1255 length:702 start_codon:yes stop_codon:yes gene_type:complete
MTDIQQAMALCAELNKTHGVKQRGGKMYTQVVHRMEAFRKVFGVSMGVDTKILVDDGQRVVVKAIITNADGIVVGSGMAEEIRGQGHVNTTSALENCESSAVGRALASIGLAGGEYASANEMDAVDRKTDIQHSQAAGAGSPPPKSNATPPEPTPEPEPVKVKENPTTEDEQDWALYKDLESQLAIKDIPAKVEKLFVDNKQRIKKISARNKERGDKFVLLFQKRLSELEGVA